MSHPAPSDEVYDSLLFPLRRLRVGGCSHAVGQLCIAARRATHQWLDLRCTRAQLIPPRSGGAAVEARVALVASKVTCVAVAM